MCHIVEERGILLLSRREISCFILLVVSFGTVERCGRGSGVGTVVKLFLV